MEVLVPSYLLGRSVTGVDLVDNSSLKSLLEEGEDSSKTPTLSAAQSEHSKKLLEFFHLPKNEYIVGEFYCSLLRSDALVKGCLYLLSAGLCFYASLRHSMSLSLDGYLNMKSHKMVPFFGRYWFVLKDGKLVGYSSAEETIFPVYSVHIRDIVEVADHSCFGKNFCFAVKICEGDGYKTWILQADNDLQKAQWMQMLIRLIHLASDKGALHYAKIVLPFVDVSDLTFSSDTDTVTVILSNEKHLLSNKQKQFCFKVEKAHSQVAFMQIQKYWNITCFKAGMRPEVSATDPTIPSSASAPVSTDPQKTPAQRETKHSSVPDLTQDIKENYLDTPALPHSANSSAIVLKKASSTNNAHKSEAHLTDSSHTDHMIGDELEGYVLVPRYDSSSSKVSVFCAPISPSSSISPSVSSASSSCSSSCLSPVSSPETATCSSKIPKTNFADVTHGHTPVKATASNASNPPESVLSDPVPRLTNSQRGNARASTHILQRPLVSSYSTDSFPKAKEDSKGLLQNFLHFVGSDHTHARKHASSNPSSTHPDSSAATPASSHSTPTPLSPRSQSLVDEKLTFCDTVDELIAIFKHGEDSTQSLLTDEPKDWEWVSIAADSNLAGLQKLEEEPCDSDTKSTSEASLQREFEQRFSLGPEERTLLVCFCTMQRVIPVPGTLYLSSNYLCFYSKAAALIGNRTMAVIPLTMIRDLKMQHLVLFSSLLVETHHNKQITFSSLKNCDKAYHLISEQMKLCNSFQPPPPTTISQILETNILTHSPGGDIASSIKPIKITLLTIGSRGDVQPFIALGLGLQKAGHKVRLATHEEFRGFVTSYGLEFAALGGNPRELMDLCVRNGLFTPSFIKEALEKFRGFVDTLMVDCWKACQGSDAIIEAPSVIAGYHIAEKLRVPFFVGFTMPYSRTRAFPHPFAFTDKPLGGSYNYMTYINRWRKVSLGLPPIGMFGGGASVLHDKAVPFLYCFSKHVVPKPPDWPDWIHLTGYWLLEKEAPRSPDWKPPQDLVDFIQAGEQPVYIGFGSIVCDDPESLTRLVVESVIKSGQRAVLAKGWGLEAGVDSVEIPRDRIFLLSSCPHDWLFPQMKTVCHHGGAGTTAAGLVAGRPTIIVSFFGDQFFWGKRVVDLGVGRTIKFLELTASKLTKSLISVCQDTKMRDLAEKLAAELHKEDSVKTAVDAFHHYLHNSTVPSLG